MAKKPNGENVIRIEGMHKWFGNFHALKDIDLEVAQGEKIVICGPSGSGKSTLIRCINRLEPHDEGRIVIDGIELTEDLKRIDEVRREVGMVFQQYALFPHMTIRENLAYPLKIRKLPKDEIRAKVEHTHTFLLCWKKTSNRWSCNAWHCA